MAKRLLSAPIAVNLEITELCNVKCRHCYNFWRDESMGSVSLKKDRLDSLIDQFVEAGIFHVVLTGGEPFSNFDLLEHGFRRLQESNISISCNSNLMLATPEKCERLAAVGLDHILTSLPSSDPATTDYIMHSPGSFERIMTGIQNATKAGIRVSVNMVITRKNMHQVYETARLVSRMGAQKLFTTRAVPPTYSHNDPDPDLQLETHEIKAALDAAIRARDDFGIMIGTLVSYPLCFLSDLEKYKDFVGRGCPAQAGNVMALNATGDSHACVHEEESYGNVFERPIAEIFQSREMRKWHDGSFHNPACDGCRYINICESGCSMTACATSGDHSHKDPLFVGPNAFARHYDFLAPELPRHVDDSIRFYAPKRLRFRKEDGFHVLNIRWANAINVSDEVAEFLIRHRDSGEPFTISDFGADRRDVLAGLLFKDAVESPDLARADDKRDKAGLSFNIGEVVGFAA